MQPIGNKSTTCAKCGYRYNLEEKFMGTLVTCPLCRDKFFATPRIL